MLIVFLLVLSAVKANESVYQDGLRKSRQLDLGLQDIHAAEEGLLTTTQSSSNSKDGLINGYLPPVSLSSLSEIISAQSQEAFDFKVVNSVEKESELCKFPFDNDACDFKDSSASNSKIPKPSRDLVPPFKDVEEKLAIKTTTALEQINKKITTTARAQKSFPSTTEKPALKFFKHEPIRKFTKIKPTALRSRVVGSKAEGTNELRSYLPPKPEFSAAAQTNIAIIQPVNGNNDHDSDHHHDHQHGDNFDICADAFHSFLCAPLKARKRITGALPTRLLGESSFINYQKTLATFDRETSSSNGFRNEYLPPNPSSTNIIQSTYLPPFTASKPVVTAFSLPTVRPYSPPKIILESSNFNDKVYLSQATNSKTSSPLKFAFSNTEYLASKVTSTPTSTLITNPTVIPTTTSTTAPTTASTKIPATTSTTTSTIAPVTTVVTSPTATPTPVSTTIPSTFSEIASDIASNSFFKNFPTAESTFNSALPTIPVFNNLRLSENGYLPPSPRPSASFVTNSKNSFPVTSTSLSPPFTSLPPSTFGLLASNSIITLTQKPKVLPTLPVFTSIPSNVTTLKPFTPISSNIFQPSNPKDSYLPPITQFQSSVGPSSTTKKTLTSTFKPVGQPSNSDLAYLPPDNKEPAAAQISSAAVVAPPGNNPFHHGRDLCTDPFHSFLCVSAKPRKKITGELPVGFKAESSNTDELRLKPEPFERNQNNARSNQSFVDASAQNIEYKYTKPVNSLPFNALSPSEPSFTEYSYSKPDKAFSPSSQQDLRFFPATSTSKPESVYRPSEAKIVSGYQYQKPDNIFSLPGEEENIKVITTTSLPTTGYSYPKPQKPFPLPTQQKEIRHKPKEKTSTPSSTNISHSTNQARGYHYPKPDQSLNLQDKKGYSYPKPEKRLELPGEDRPKSLLAQNDSNLNGLGSLGSADFIPVNKIEFKRAESSKLLSGLRRFGERMKKRERQAQLLKRQLQ